ncbi:MAG: citrate synthase [Elusimicrobia bacterium]|nr:citrate synthase [Elusimicrobiota bacterium]
MSDSSLGTAGGTAARKPLLSSQPVCSHFTNGDVAQHSASITIDGKTYALPVLEGTEGELAVDISRLRAQSGVITYDPGYGNTGSCKSAITFIDGEKGILRYRGIPIEEFDRPHPDFLEVAMLVILGELPTRTALDRFRAVSTANANLDESMKHHFEGFPISAPPMAQLSAMINAISCFHPEYFTFTDAAHFEEAAARVISQIRTVAAYSYRHSRGLPFIYPNPALRYCANFLHMMFSMPYQEVPVEPEVEDALNLLFILHADHEQNCSTSTVRMVGSSQANLFASCASGVCALWGPLHGGANLAVIEMLEEIHRGRMRPEEAVAKAKGKKSGFRLMGFGHRVYKNYDPRAKIMKRCCDRVLGRLGVEDPLLDIALRLEELALKDPYFVEKKLYPNVDFYSGIIMRAIGIPTSMFPVMFSIGRLPGWIAQWGEQNADPDARIARPRQIFVGQTARKYAPIEER